MKELQFIKSYYKPIQPTVKAENGKVVYREISPEIEIENFVYCFWQLRTKTTLDQNFIYRVVSDGCIDIFFDHTQTSENFVMGFCRKYTEFYLDKSFDYIGIRFLPAVFPLLFEVNAKTLSDESHRLNEILPELSNWITTEIRPDHSFENIVKQLNRKFKRIKKKRNFKHDPRFFNALEVIFQRRGFLDIEKELDTGFSPRQLRRVFNFYLGTTAKTFCNVVRFQHILNAKPSKQSLKENKVYFDVGFYDQAHFIKNFSTFYGVTPSRAFQ